LFLAFDRLPIASAADSFWQQPIRPGATSAATLNDGVTFTAVTLPI
jgi:hypothetical protein